MKTLNPEKSCGGIGKMQMMRFRCDICGSDGDVDRMREREIVGKQRKVCPDCHTYLESL